MCHDETELAVARQRKRGQEAAAGSQLETREHPEIQPDLRRQQQAQDRGGAELLGRGESQEPDLQEKTDQKQLLQTPQRSGQLFCTRVSGQQSTHDQGAQLRAEVQTLESQPAHDQRHDDTKNNEQLVMTTELEQPEQHGA